MAVKKTKTVCTTCHTRCGAIVYSEENKILRVEGDPDNPLSRGVFCASGMSQREIHNNPEGRILYPMKRVGERGSGKWERISWDEALTIMTEKAKELIEKYGPDSVIVGQGTGRTTNHWHIRFNSTIGQESWGLAPTHVCLMPQILPNAFTLGLFAPTSGDIVNAKTMVIWGTNPTMLYGATSAIMDNQEAGAKLIVIDVRFTDFAKNADLFIRPRPGTDGALALGIMNIIIENGWYDQAWIDKWTYGFDELKARCAEFPADRVAEITGVPEEQIREAAKLMSQHGPSTIVALLGPGCMHTNGIQAGRAIACLIGLLGDIDVPGGILIDPSFDIMLDDRITLWNSKKDPGRPELFAFGGDKYPMYKAFARSNHPYATFDAVITGKPKPVKMFVFVASDPLLCYEDTKHTYKALTSENLELLVVKDFYFSPTAQLADIVLPSADWSERDTWDEEISKGWIFPTERAVDPPGECWDDWKFFLEWGKCFSEELWPWKDEKEMMLWRYKEFYGLDMTWDEFIAGGYIPPKQQSEFKKYETGKLRPDGQPGFPTSTGLIEFLCPTMEAFGYDPLPNYEEPAESPISRLELEKEYPFILTTGFRLYSFFHSAWTNIPMQRQPYPHPFVLINPKDALKLNITEGEWVGIESPRGKVKAKARITHEIGEGVVALPRPGWRDPCPELGLPGYGWDQANPNILIPAEPAEPRFGSSPMRSTLCRIVKEVS